MIPHCGRAITLLLPLLSQATESTLVLLMEALETSLRAGPVNLNSDDYVRISSTILSVWAAHANGASECARCVFCTDGTSDPLIAASVSDLLAGLAGSPDPSAVNCIATNVLPQLSIAISKHRTDPSSVEAASAVGIVDGVLIGYGNILPPGTFASIAPELLAFLSTSDDRGVIQEGLDALAQCVKKGATQILEW